MWKSIEGRFGAAHLALRDSQAHRVLDLGDGRTLWQGVAEKPVAGFEVIGDLLVVGSDQVNAYALGSGQVRWQHDLRGAEIAATPDGQRIIVANEQRIVALSLGGESLWQAPLPPFLAGSVPERLSADDHTAYLTFAPPGPPDRSGPPMVDALAISLDG
jgi:hypothetical protein